MKLDCRWQLGNLHAEQYDPQIFRLLDAIHRTGSLNKGFILTIQSSEFKNIIARLPGYDASRAGEITSIKKSVSLRLARREFARHVSRRR